MSMERLTGKGMSTLLTSEIYKRLMEYEDEEEQGLLLRLPCKVGETVYRLQYVDDWEKPGFFTLGVAETTFSIYLLSEFGKTVFLTREEAEAALKEG